MDEVQQKNKYYLLPLKDFVIFPKMVVPLFVGRKKSVKALDNALENKIILLVSQIKSNIENPKPEDLYSVGIESKVIQQMQLPDGTVKILVEGLRRVKIVNYLNSENYFEVEGSYLDNDNLEDIAQEQGVYRSLMSQFEIYVGLNGALSNEIITTAKENKDLKSLVDVIASYVTLNISDKQSLLDTENLNNRAKKLVSLLEREIEFLNIDQKIRGNVKEQMEKTQKEYYLNEQMRAIQKELTGGSFNEAEQLEKKLSEIKLPKEAREKVSNELNKYKMMPPMSAEATVCRNYIETLLDLPWDKKNSLTSNLPKAKDTLDKQHYGLEETKDRILEFLAVQKRVKKFPGQILCLVGPPGVGKTSLGRSIADATNRKYTRIALGGVRDESEIRGHRRTYIGAMPGKIIQKIIKTKTKNPLILLDEIDKIGADNRGDPASALLEVLDREQNKNFNDHYLEVDFDLSEVMFITTANSLNIPPALLDRMDVVKIPGYTEQEKLYIARDYLLPKQLKANGLLPEEISVNEDALIEVIRYYTREAGVRNLERNIAKICRKVVRNLLENENEEKSLVAVTSENVSKYLGVRKFRFGQNEKASQIGQVIGLAWTEVGGDILNIEAVALPGNSETKRTGKLGEVMRESIDAAMSVARTLSVKYGIDKTYFKEHDFHIHVPEGATPKDGPSAGVAICTALMSLILNRKVCKDVAMTGEITLRGKILAIGGLREKLLAAKLAGIKTVIIPKDNEHELQEIPDYAYEGLNIHALTNIEEVLSLSLED